MSTLTLIRDDKFRVHSILYRVDSTIKTPFVISVYVRKDALEAEFNEFPKQLQFTIEKIPS